MRGLAPRPSWARLGRRLLAPGAFTCSIDSDCTRQIEAKALRKLKHPSRSRKLHSFLDN